MLTDDEINKRVADLQGWVFIPPDEGHYGKMTYPKWRHSQGAEYVSENPPAYATDWAWCGPLVEKCGLEVGIRRKTGAWSATTLGVWEEADTPQRAICLAVIAAHAGSHPNPAETQAKPLQSG